MYACKPHLRQVSQYVVCVCVRVGACMRVSLTSVRSASILCACMYVCLYACKPHPRQVSQYVVCVCVCVGGCMRVSLTSVRSASIAGLASLAKATIGSSRKSTCPTRMLAHSLPAGILRINFLFGWKIQTKTWSVHCETLNSNWSQECEDVVEISLGPELMSSYCAVFGFCLKWWAGKEVSRCYTQRWSWGFHHVQVAKGPRGGNPLRPWKFQET